MDNRTGPSRVEGVEMTWGSLLAIGLLVLLIVLRARGGG